MDKRTVLWSTFVITLLTAGDAVADLHPLHHVDLSTPAKREASELTTESAKDLTAGKYQQAENAAERAAAVDPSDAWAFYDEGVALTELGKTDDAVAAFYRADARFSPNDAWGRSISLFGRARALQMAGRCKDAELAFNQYASLVKGQAPELAREATSQACATQPPQIAGNFTAAGTPIAQAQPQVQCAPARAASQHLVSRAAQSHRLARGAPVRGHIAARPRNVQVQPCVPCTPTNAPPSGQPS